MKEDGRISPYVIVSFLDGIRSPQHNLSPLVEVGDISSLSSINARRYVVGYGVVPIPR